MNQQITVILMVASFLQAKMDGELNCHTTPGMEAVAAAVAVVAVAVVVVVVVEGLVLIWSVMNVVRLVTLLVSAEWGVVLEGVGVAALLQDTAGAQVMVGGIVN